MSKQPSRPPQSLGDQLRDKYQQGKISQGKKQGNSSGTNRSRGETVMFVFLAQDKGEHLLMQNLLFAQHAPEALSARRTRIILGKGKGQNVNNLGYYLNGVRYAFESAVKQEADGKGAHSVVVLVGAISEKSASPETCSFMLQEDMTITEYLCWKLKEIYSAQIESGAITVRNLVTGQEAVRIVIGEGFIRNAETYKEQQEAAKQATPPVSDPVPLPNPPVVDGDSSGNPSDEGSPPTVVSSGNPDGDGVSSTVVSPENADGDATLNPDTLVGDGDSSKGSGGDGVSPKTPPPNASSDDPKTLEGEILTP